MSLGVVKPIAYRGPRPARVRPRRPQGQKNPSAPTAIPSCRPARPDGPHGSAVRRTRRTRDSARFRGCSRYVRELESDARNPCHRDRSHGPRSNHPTHRATGRLWRECEMGGGSRPGPFSPRVGASTLFFDNSDWSPALLKADGPSRPNAGGTGEAKRTCSQRATASGGDKAGSLCDGPSKPTTTFTRWSVIRHTQK